MKIKFFFENVRVPRFMKNYNKKKRYNVEEPTSELDSATEHITEMEWVRRISKQTLVCLCYWIDVVSRKTEDNLQMWFNEFIELKLQIKFQVYVFEPIKVKSVKRFDFSQEFF